jgi:cytosine/adenosine deaminase-related metal-dependent hydrolase
MRTHIRTNEVSGHIFWENRMQRGTLRLDGDALVFSKNIPNSPAYFGTLIPAPFNSHVHVSDSFIKEEPPSNLRESVGPGGFKHSALEKASRSEKEAGIRKSLETMNKTGSFGFCDFREGGVEGTKLARDILQGQVKVILGRPERISEIDQVLRSSDGIAMSSILDVDPELLRLSSERAHRERKLFALHLSETAREDAAAAIELNPNFLVHCGFCSDSDLDMINKKGISIAIAPRSNSFYGIRVDYSRFIGAGINVMLGTDNCMVVSPDLFAEMSFLYLNAKFTKRIDPESILSMATVNWRKTFQSGHAKLRNKFLFFSSRLMTPYEVVMRSSGQQFLRIEMKN